LTGGNKSVLPEKRSGIFMKECPAWELLITGLTCRY
jgi:hypothetical protein